MGERRMQLRADWRYIIEIELENFRIRMTKIIDEMFVKKDDVITDKQELEIKETGCEIQRNESNPVLEKIEAVADEIVADEVVADEIGVVAQAQMNTKIKNWSKQEWEIEDVMIKDQVSETIKYEDGKSQVRLGVENSNPMEQQADQTHGDKVTNKNLNVVDACGRLKGAYLIDVCEKFDTNYSMVFVDEILVYDPYGFRLLVMDFDCNLKHIKESITRAKDVMIRPKMWLANDGNYRKLRWFTAWKQDQLVEFLLPLEIFEALSQTSVPFGSGYIQFLDTTVAAEICEELFTLIPSHTELAVNRVEIFLNASGSHRPLKKLNLRLQAFIGATYTRVGLYMYRNHNGCDGGRLYYDGCCCIVVKGEVVAQGSQFSLKDLEIVVAQVELERVASLRGSISCFLEQANGKPKVSLVAVPYNMCRPFNLKMLLSSLQKVMYHSPEEEIALGPDCWLWDYLSRSEAVDEAVLNGFQLLVFLLMLMSWKKLGLQCQYF